MTPARHTESFPIRAYECDPHGRLLPRTLCLLLQETAAAHALELGVAVETLLDRGVAWVLSQLSVTVDRWPVAGETLLIEQHDRELLGRIDIELVTGLLVIAGLPHLVWMGFNQFSGRSLGLDGMEWMHPGDRAIVRHLRLLPTETTVVESVGGAYTEYARFSAYSGVPAVIGWENHEMVWRGHEVTGETNRRSELVREIYSCGDPVRVLALVEEAGASVVAIGALERKDYAEESLASIRQAGEVVLNEDGGFLVRFGVDSEGAPQEAELEGDDG